MKSNQQSIRSIHRVREKTPTEAILPTKGTVAVSASKNMAHNRSVLHFLEGPGI